MMLPITSWCVGWFADDNHFGMDRKLRPSDDHINNPHRLHSFNTKPSNKDLLCIVESLRVHTHTTLYKLLFRRSKTIEASQGLTGEPMSQVYHTSHQGK